MANPRFEIRFGSRQTRNATDQRIRQNWTTIHREVIARSPGMVRDF